MLPEEQELNRLESEQAALEEQVATAELALETGKTETVQFQHRYHQTVGRLYAQLDELDAQIARVQAGLSPNDAAAQIRAQAAEKQAQTSAEEEVAGIEFPTKFCIAICLPKSRLRYQTPDLILSNSRRSFLVGLPTCVEALAFNCIAISSRRRRLAPVSLYIF